MGLNISGPCLGLVAQSSTAHPNVTGRGCPETENTQREGGEAEPQVMRAPVGIVCRYRAMTSLDASREKCLLPGEK